MDNLKGCQVHVFDHCQQVTIDDCEDSTIVIGPCQDSVFARDCKNCVIHVVAQQLRTRGCLDCTFFLWVPTEPVIEASVGLRIGAWHVSYPGLSRHMQAAQLNPTDPNMWDHVCDCTPADEDDGEHWRRVARRPELPMKIEGVDAPCDTPLPKPAPASPVSASPVASPRPARSAAATAAAPAAAAPAAAAPAEQPAAPDSGAASASGEARYFRVVYSGVVAVRDGPSRDASEVGERMPGDIVEAAEVQEGWIRLQPPPGFTGGPRWVCAKVGTTTLLDEVPLSEVPLSARGGSPRAREQVLGSGKGKGATEAKAGGGGGFSPVVMVVALLALALLAVLGTQHTLDGAPSIRCVETQSPAPDPVR